MKHLLFLVFGFFVATSLFGQVDTSVVSLVAYWYKGDVYNYEITKVKKSWEQDEIADLDSTTYYARFEVLDSTTAGYTIKWSYTPEDLLGMEGSKAISDMEETIKPIDLIYTTTELGEILELTNWKEVSEQSTNLLTQTLKYTDPDNSAYAEALEPVIDLYSTKEGVETYAMQEVNVLHFLYGLEYNTDSPIEYEDEFPNLFGSKPIRADAAIEFTEVDTSDHYFVAEQRSTLNEEDTKDIIGSLMKQLMGRKKGKEFKQYLKDAEFTINDNNVYEFYYYPGVANYIKTLRKSNIVMGEKKNRKEEYLEIILLYDDEDQ